MKSETNQKHRGSRVSVYPTSALSGEENKFKKKRTITVSFGGTASTWGIRSDRPYLPIACASEKTRIKIIVPRLASRTYHSPHTLALLHLNTLPIAPKYNRRPEPRNAFHTVRGLECGEERHKHPPKAYRQKQFSQSATSGYILTGECFWTMAFDYDESW